MREGKKICSSAMENPTASSFKRESLDPGGLLVNSHTVFKIFPGCDLS